MVTASPVEPVSGAANPPVARMIRLACNGPVEVLMPVIWLLFVMNPSKVVLRATVTFSESLTYCLST